MYNRFITRVLRRLTLYYDRVFSVAQKWNLRRRGVCIGSHFICYGKPAFLLAGGSRIRVGDHFTVCSRFLSNPIGCPHPSLIRTLQRGASIEFGNNVGLSSTVISALDSIVVGSGTLLGSGSIVMDNDFHAWNGMEWVSEGASSAPVIIGPNCFIGARAMVLKGVTLGDCCVVGAGAVVTAGHYPSRSILAGNPARVVGALKD